MALPWASASRVRRDTEGRTGNRVGLPTAAASRGGSPRSARALSGHCGSVEHPCGARDGDREPTHVLHPATRYSEGLCRERCRELVVRVEGPDAVLVRPRRRGCVLGGRRLELPRSLLLVSRAFEAFCRFIPRGSPASWPASKCTRNRVVSMVAGPRRTSSVRSKAPRGQSGGDEGMREVAAHAT